MTADTKSPAAAEKAALRLRQRRIGRELRLFYERVLREPLPADMLDALIEADARGQTIDPGSASSAAY
ncbi:MAG: hypothetical protein ACREHF_08245 [Rhizomicrobium sp.]